MAIRSPRKKRKAVILYWAVYVYPGSVKCRVKIFEGGGGLLGQNGFWLKFIWLRVCWKITSVYTIGTTFVFLTRLGLISVDFIFCKVFVIVIQHKGCICYVMPNNCYKNRNLKFKPPLEWWLLTLCSISFSNKSNTIPKENTGSQMWLNHTRQASCFYGIIIFY